MKKYSMQYLNPVNGVSWILPCTSKEDARDKIPYDAKPDGYSEDSNGGGITTFVNANGLYYLIEEHNND